MYEGIAAAEVERFFGWFVWGTVGVCLAVVCVVGSACAVAVMVAWARDVVRGGA